MPILAYRTQQSTDTTGTGPLALNAAASAMRSFQAAFGTSARRLLYCISWATGFEIGHGQFDGQNPGALTRASILASSNAGNPVALPPGTKDVFAVLEPNAREVSWLAAGATLSLAELGNLVVFTGTAPASLALPAVALVPSGMGVLVRNSGTADLVVDPAGTETVNGGPSVTLPPGFAAELLATGTGWAALFCPSPQFGRIIGELIPLAGPALPPLCVWPNGQNLSRSTYAALFAALGTTYGAGDGSTTFGTPDLRGRSLFARDTLGGSAAGRITSAGSGIAGSTLGAAGGDERMPAHAHGINDPWHAHGAWSGHAGWHSHGPNRPFGVLTWVDPDTGAWVHGAPSGAGPFIRTESASYIDQGALIGGAGDHAHGIGVAGAGTGISLQTAGAGTAQNMPPALICTYALFAGA